MVVVYHINLLNRYCCVGQIAFQPDPPGIGGTVSRLLGSVTRFYRIVKLVDDNILLAYIGGKCYIVSKIGETNLTNNSLRHTLHSAVFLLQ